MDDDFEHQLRLEKEEKERQAATSNTAKAVQGTQIGANPYIYTDTNDGTVYEWDHEKRAWFPKIDENFLAAYQSHYGYAAASEGATKNSLENTGGTLDNENIDELEKTTDEVSQGNSSNSDAPGSQILKKKRLQSAQKRPATWFELDDADNTKVYVSGLPTQEFCEQKFIELMSKYGMLFKDETGKYKVKLYKNSDGTLKGDGLCTYLKVESVDLALQLLDGSTFEGKEIHVEKAKFQLKGEYDPSKKPKQLKRKDKEKLRKKIDKLFAWKPDKLRGERPKSDSTVVFRNFFDPKDFDEDARLILEYQKDLREECETFGELKKVVIYDRNPSGIATVTFKEVEHADACIAAMKGRFFAGKQLGVDHWDGKEKYKIVETEKELEARLKKWDEFLENDD